MTSLFRSIRKSPQTWLWSAIFFTLFAGLLVSLSARCLKTDSAPLAIVSLELAWQQHHADSIRNEWAHTRCYNGSIIMETIAAPGAFAVSHAAQENILDDMWFLVAYTLFFIVCVVRMDPLKFPGQPVTRRTFVFVELALVAGLLDAVENFFMWRFLKGDEVPSYAFALPATVKFLFILILIGYILLYLLRKALATKARRTG